MQEYTSLETSKKIYKMFGWGDTKHIWHNLASAPHIFEREGFYERGLTTLPPYPVPAYSLPYLLDKLQTTDKTILLRFNNPEQRLAVALPQWNGKYTAATASMPQSDYIVSDIPVEAAALLCLELGKQGILPRKDK